MELTGSNEFALKKNVFSMHKAPTHFTPIWFPDGAKYTPQVKAIDIWTPAGELYVYSEDERLEIDGGTYFDDWHVGPALAWG